MTRNTLALLGASALFGVSAVGFGIYQANQPAPIQPVMFTANCTPAAPVITSITTQNGKVTLNWSPVTCARAYAVRRSDGQMGSTIFLTYTDQVQPGRKVSYTVSGIAPDTLVREGLPSGGVTVVAE